MISISTDENPTNKSEGNAQSQKILKMKNEEFLKWICHETPNN